MEIYFDSRGVKIEKPDEVVPEWRISVYSLIVVNKKILTLRTFFSDSIELPGGKVEINESISEGAKRECYEETGYKIEIENEPIYVGERNFFCSDLEKYYKSVIIVYPGRLVDERPDVEMINKVEPDEVKEVNWLDFADFNQDNTHPIVWPAIKKFITSQNN